VRPVEPAAHRQRPEWEAHAAPLDEMKLRELAPQRVADVEGTAVGLDITQRLKLVGMQVVR
jgi:hypothetical protein